MNRRQCVEAAIDLVVNWMNLSWQDRWALDESGDPDYRIHDEWIRRQTALYGHDFDPTGGRSTPRPELWPPPPPEPLWPGRRLGRLMSRGAPFWCEEHYLDKWLD